MVDLEAAARAKTEEEYDRAFKVGVVESLKELLRMVQEIREQNAAVNAHRLDMERRVAAGEDRMDRFEERLDAAHTHEHERAAVSPAPARRYGSPSEILRDFQLATAVAQLVAFLKAEWAIVTAALLGAAALWEFVSQHWRW